MQVWYGSYFGLDQVYSVLSQLDDGAHKHTKVHELFLTWTVAKFLQFQRKREHFLGFPSLRDDPNVNLSDFLVGNAAMNDENFDTVIIDSARKEIPIRLQIKRYTNALNASTADFFHYLSTKTGMYGNAPEINIVFHIQQQMKFDLGELQRLLKGSDFQVSSIWVFAETASHPSGCVLFEVHPKFTGELWSPSSKK